MLTSPLSELGTVRPRDPAPEAELAANHVGQLDVNLIVADGAPCIVVEDLNAALIRFPPDATAGQAYFEGRRKSVRQLEQPMAHEEDEAQHGVSVVKRKSQPRSGENGRHINSCTERFALYF